MDDSPLIPRPAPEGHDDGEVDRWLMTWFQLRLADPVPERFLDLIERLNKPGGM